MIPVNSMIWMAVGAVVGIGVPVLLAWWLVKKYGLNWKTVGIGAAVFVVFAIVLEPIAHQLVLKGPNGPAIQGNVWLYALYGGCMAALFEETGRFIGMKWLLKDQPSGARSGVGYGIGHGGAEMILVYGFTMISNLALSALINTGQADTLLAGVPAESQGQVQAQFAALESLGAGSILLGLWERASALILQLGLSLIVWTAVRRGGKWLWLLAAAYLLHFLADATVVVLAKSVSMLAVEAVVFALAVAVGAIGWKLATSAK